MPKYDIFEKDGAVFRGVAGDGFVQDVLTPDGWKDYEGDPCAPVTFGTFLRTEEHVAAGGAMMQAARKLAAE